MFINHARSLATELAAAPKNGSPPALFPVTGTSQRKSFRRPESRLIAMGKIGQDGSVPLTLTTTRRFRYRLLDERLP
jgi:hypothetical protein